MKSDSKLFPPKLARQLLRWFLKDELREEVEGDLEEKFYAELEDESPRKAQLHYWYQVGHYLRPFAIKRSNNSNNITMFRHYWKVSYRNLLKQKGYAAIKIGGLAVGIAACLLLGLYVKSERDYDQFYEHQSQLYRLTNQYTTEEFSDRWVNLQGPLKEIVVASIPEIELVAKTVWWSWYDAGENYIRPTGKTSNIYEEGFIYADPEFLEIMEVPMVYGPRSSALSEPKSIVISASKAEKYFPGEDPVGKQLVFNDNPENVYTIGGVMKGFSKSSHLRGDFIMTMEGRTNGPGAIGWCCSNYSYYVRLREGVDKKAVEQNLTSLIGSHVIDRLAAEGKTGLDEMKKHQSYYLQPIADVHLNEDRVGDHLQHGDSEMVWMFGVISLLILLLAAINFINLSTAKATTRAKEVGLRKVVGSARSGLVFQYLMESVLYSFLSVLLGVLLMVGFLPVLNEMLDATITVPWLEPWFLPAIFVGTCLVGICSGMYPALFLSRFTPIEAIMGRLGKLKKSQLQSSMVVLQFTITVVLLICSAFVYLQHDHFMNVALGYEKDQVLLLQGVNLKKEQQQSLKNELQQLAEVKNAALSDFYPVAGGAVNNITYWPSLRRQLDRGVEAARWAIDEDYLSTMGMHLTAGRNFMDIFTDEEGILLNESMVEALGLEEPVGTRLVDMFEEKHRVIGVVEDFYFESLGQEVRPLVMVRGSSSNTLLVKVAANNMTHAMEAIDAVWKGFLPHQVMRSDFMDQRFAQMYRTVKQLGRMFLFFSGIAISIACLGLFALSAFMLEQRIKEVSIRKVLGAELMSLFRLLTFGFVKLVLIATALAIPLGWMLMDELLADITNRVTLDWWVFAGVSLFALVIAVVTVSFESIKAALVNPAKRLRSE